MKRNQKIRQLKAIVGAKAANNDAFNLNSAIQFRDKRKETETQHSIIQLATNYARHAAMDNPTPKLASEQVKYGEVIQRKDAARAGLVPGFAAGASVNLYNTRAKIGLPQGTLYTKVLAGVNTVGEVMNEYMKETGALGKRQESEEYLDTSSGVTGYQQIGNKIRNANRPVKERENVNKIKDFLKVPTADTTTVTTTNFPTRYQEIQGNRAALRGINNIGLVDPFVTRLDIPQNGKPNWEFETNFSNSALSYLSKVKVGEKDVTGTITPKDDFEKGASPAKDDTPTQHAFKFSSAHDTSTAHTVGAQIDSLTPGVKNEDNHAGFDAVAKLGAEGARFLPVQALGLKLKENSKFFIFDEPQLKIRYLTFHDLYANWGKWFQRKYQITADQVKAQVLKTGTLGKVNTITKNDFDLDINMVVTSPATYVASAERIRLSNLEKGFKVEREPGQYEHTNSLIGRHGTGTSRATLNQQDTTSK